MVTLVVLINLFFVPSIALFIYNKNHNIGFEPSIKLLIQYAVFSSCNVPLTKISVFVFKKIFVKVISLDSGYYTLLAIISASILPYLLDYFCEIYINKNAVFEQMRIAFARKKIKYKQKFVTSLFLMSLIMIAIVVRGPLEIFAGNTKDFLFSLEDFFPAMLLLTILIVVVCSCLIALLRDVLFHIMSVLLLWIGAAFWIQDLFLNKKLSEINGGPMDWTTLGTIPVTNFIIWIVMLGFFIYLYLKFRKSWFSFVKLVSGALCMIQVVACVTVLLTIPPKNTDKESYLSGEKQMQLASDENVIVLVFDGLATTQLKLMLDQYPEAKTIMKDFTFYDNACSNYAPTYPSVTHFLTGYELEFGISAQTWMKNAWTSPRCNQFYQNLMDLGYTCRIYATGVGYVYGDIENLEGKFENISSTTLKADQVNLVKKLLKLSIYRFSPYVFKPAFEVITSDFDDIVVSMDVPRCTKKNNEFYQRLLDEKLSVDSTIKKLFVYEHLEGAHPPFTTDAQANYVKEGTTETDAIRGIFTILNEYFNQMKELNLYDQSTIIVMADHGNFHGDCAPAVYLKQPNETHEKAITSTAPIEYSDFQATIMELVGKNDGSFGTSFFDWKSDEERRRIMWFGAVDDSKPEAPGSNWNMQYGFIYYKNEDELKALRKSGTPDFIEPANSWLSASMNELGGKR